MFRDAWERQERRDQHSKPGTFPSLPPEPPSAGAQ
jgi:hypothetical protein